MSAPASWRSDFPALQQQVHGKRLVYLDTGATALVPRVVIDAVVATYARDAGSVHRGVHELADRASIAYDTARASIAALFGVPADEIVLASGATDALNGVAQGWVRRKLERGDAVIVTELEHHANLVPWQEVCAERGAELRVCAIDDHGVLDLDHLERLLADRRARAVAVTQLSNVTGTAPPIDRVVERAHAKGAIVVVDGAQGAAHLPPRPCGDFWICSGHKLHGPSGTGVLWARRGRLAELAPWRTGGAMVAAADYQHARFHEPPARFEAGTPNVAGVIGLGAAACYLAELGDARLAHEQALHAELVAALHAAPGVRVLGAPAHALASFTVDGVHPHDLATLLDRDGVAIRSGHHCAQPLHGRLGVTASARASLGLYNGSDDVAALIAAIAHAREVLRVIELYPPIVVEHGKHPHRTGALPAATHAATLDNPLCGDIVTLQLVVAAGTIADVAHDGHGCTLVRAASSLLADRLVGLAVPDALVLATAFEAFVAGEPARVALRELVVFAPLRAHRARRACATLPARVLIRALG